MYTHTSYILLHFTQRHGSCLSSSVINYLTRIASDHKWYKWSSQKQLIIRSDNVSKLPRWWWRHCASLPQARKREVEQPIRHPDMCIDRLIHAMKQLLRFIKYFCRISKRTIKKNKSFHCKFMRSFDWSMALWLLVVSLARFFNIDDSRVLQVPSCPQDGGLVQGWESVCSIGFQNIIIDFPK